MVSCRCVCCDVRVCIDVARARVRVCVCVCQVIGHLAKDAFSASENDASLANTRDSLLQILEVGVLCVDFVCIRACVLTCAWHVGARARCARVHAQQSAADVAHARRGQVRAARLPAERHQAHGERASLHSTECVIRRTWRVRTDRPSRGQVGQRAQKRALAAAHAAAVQPVRWRSARH
jgi:hypothetical protein